ncbi:MAG TPA: protein kinase [Polyangiaceae bacterium]|nr:protein kinase [Polyangiaceae bacterium]
MPRDVEVRADEAGVAPAIGDWGGTARYEVVRRIGEGALGVVYEAHDRERGHRVALKVLRQFDPAALLMLKDEFRTLIDVHHRNLVRLYELSAIEGEPTFFSMELVLGAHFLSYVRRSEAGREIDDAPVAASRRTPNGSPRSTPVPSSRPGEGPRPRTLADLERLRASLRQLVAGVQALHDAGKLHRDIKPSNVLVGTDGRVVLLDFGVATEMSRAADRNLRQEGQIVGTVRYMAPEQGFGEAAIFASDWYSVGVVLYEALVGRAPFEGAAIDVLYAKAMADTPRPSSRAAGVPQELDELCSQLLHPHPNSRPTGPEILERLGVPFSAAVAGPRASLHPTSSAWPLARDAALVGRQGHLQALAEAFDAASGGRLVTVRVRGAPGMGKSSLVQHFLDDLLARGRAVVLRGRTYERESVPYKAVDALVDELSRHLIHLVDESESVELPADMPALSRLFPVLGRLPDAGDVPEGPVTDPQRSRLRAFAAFRALVGRLSAREPLALFIDDVQWGDVDSAALILELVRPPQTARVLLILAQRDDAEASVPFLTELRARWPEGAELREVLVGPIETADARQLALSILGYDDASGQSLAQALAEEARGSPFLVQELARRGPQTALAEAGASLRELVSGRMAGLGEDARRLMEIVAVAGRPLAASTLAQAAEVDAHDDILGLLARERLIRAGMRDGREVIEPIHDRIRETVVEGLEARAVRRHHARLATVLEATPGADPESIALHLFGAGDGARASQFAERAATQAEAQLAFDQAARLLARALEASPDSPEGSRLRVRLAEALVLAGRSEDAAGVYAQAAEGASGTERADLQRAAAEQLLLCGHTEDGGKLLRAVLRTWGMTVPRSPITAVLWLIFYRFGLAIRGLHFEEREPDAVRIDDRARVDALHAVALGLGVVDIVLSACVQARHLTLALDVGHRLQVMRAASLEASHLAGQGGPETPREHELVAIVQRLAERDANADAHRAFFQARHGIRLFLRGRWKDAREVLDEAYARYPDNRASVNSSSYLFSLYSLWFLGDIEELTRRKAHLLAEAEQRRDLYTLVNLQASWTTLTAVASDDVDSARRSLRTAMASWSHSGFSIQHWQAMVIEALVEMYAGNGPEARARIERDARPLKRSFLLKGQSLRGQTAYVRGLAAIASMEGAAPSLRRERLAEALAAAKALENERMPWTAPLASIVSAAVANARGDRDVAVGALRAATDQARAADMPLYAVAAMHRLGLVLGGDDGMKLASAAVRTLAGRGVRVPERFAAMLVPGRWVNP